MTPNRRKSIAHYICYKFFAFQFEIILLPRCTSRVNKLCHTRFQHTLSHCLQSTNLHAKKDKSYIPLRTSETKNKRSFFSVQKLSLEIFIYFCDERHSREQKRNFPFHISLLVLFFLGSSCGSRKMLRLSDTTIRNPCSDNFA